MYDGVNGAPVSPYSLSNYVINSGTSAPTEGADLQRGLKANLARDFQVRGVPFTIKVGAAQAEDSAAPGTPGQILAADRTGVRVACGQGVLVLTQLQRPGGKMLPAGEFLAGFPLAVGETLTSEEMPAFVASAPFPRAPKA